MGLKNLFVKEDSSEEEVVDKKSNGKSTSAPTNISSINTQFSPPAISSAEKNEFAEFLNEIYQKGNFAGPDYQEFTDALKELASTPMDEKTKFNAIFVGFKVQGVTKARLIETAQKYIQLIASQSNDFAKEIDSILSTDVAGKQNQCSKILQENAEIEKQMIALNEKKNKNLELINKLSGEITEQVSGLTVKKTSFEAASNDFINTVKSNIDKINQYLA